MPARIDYYATLGIDSNATSAQIKDAYRTRAKAAHPDAGGSVEAMATINEAHQVLSDPGKRRDYDAMRRTSRREPGYTPTEPRPSSPSESPAEPARTGHRADVNAQAEFINRQRTKWARASALELARLSAPLAIVVITLTRIISNSSQTSSTRAAAGFFAFVPVYALALSIVFLISPPVRLVYADLVRRHRTTWTERATALALVLAFIPLAMIWVALFY